MNDVSARRLAPPQVEEFRRLAYTLSDAALACRFCMGETTARRYRQRLGVIRPHLPTNHVEVNDELLRAGWGKLTLGQMVAQLGVCRETVRRRARELGLHNGHAYHAQVEVLPPEQLEQFIALVRDERVKLRTAVRVMGLSWKVAHRLRRQLGLLRRIGPKKGQSQYSRDLWKQLPNPPAGLVVGKWRCWRCDRLTLDPTCPSCGGSFGQKE